jgi:hypothetical protein
VSEIQVKPSQLIPFLENVKITAPTAEEKWKKRLGGRG